MYRPQFGQPVVSPGFDPLNFGGSFQNLLNYGEFSPTAPVDHERERESQATSEEVIPETQPDQTTSRGKQVVRRHRKKDAAEPRQKTEKRKWTEEEEVALASSWVATSEDPIHGRDQTSPIFWDKVRDKFFYKMHQRDPTYFRTTDMISSKWSDLKRKVKKFNGIMRQKMQNRRSGASDQNIIDEAMTQYRLVQGGHFQHMSCWDILKNSPVCQAIPIPGGPSKRSKTSDSSSPATPSTPFSAFDLNDTDDELQMFEEDLPRPVGRDQAKAKARNKGKGKGVSTSKTDEQLELMNERFGEFNEKSEEKSRQRAIKIIMKDTSNLAEPYRTVAEKEKDRLIAKYFSG